MAAIAARITLGFERTTTSDLALGLRQLTDVAVKALSPGINDPTTAVHALGHSSALLCQLSQISLGPRPLRDADGTVRVVLSRHVFGELLALAVEQPALYGSGDPLVMARLFMLLREVAWAGGQSRRTACRRPSWLGCAACSTALSSTRSIKRCWLPRQTASSRRWMVAGIGPGAPSRLDRGRE